MMSALFIAVLNMSITASYAAIGVLLVRPALKKAPKIYAYALWSAVLVRMVAPVTLSSAFSLFGFLQTGDRTEAGRMVFVPPAVGYMQQPEIATGIATLDRAVNVALPEAIVGSSVNPMQLILWGASLVWAAGAVILLAYSMAVYWRTARSVRTATRIMGNVYESDRIGSPFVFGWIRPNIYVPVGLGERELRFIVAHEQTHIRRRDYLVKPIAYLALIVHWFNPLMWLSFAAMSKDMEMACDEGALQSLGGDNRHGYSQALLLLSTGKRNWLQGGPLTFGENHVTARIKRIVRYRRPGKRAMAFAFIAVAALIAGFVVNPAASATINADSGADGNATKNANANIGAGDEQPEPEREPQPQPDSAYVLSTNRVEPAGGGLYDINVEMVNGNHLSEEEAGGPGGGVYPDNYRGIYRLRVVNPLLSTQGSTASVYQGLSEDFGEQALNFAGRFDLALADYNGDGQLDFTLGQWGGSNGDFYCLYTLNARGKIEKLNTGGELYITDHEPSAPLDQVDGTSFAVKYYDQLSGAYKQHVYRWETDKFVRLKE
ncbi:hypothetical protein GZH47_15430 [Paenibacillus rhizovicinus]|uniref:Peptidase M56 domain-containing protein n=1 Tax=Paenibacillus rhizovicinus TaxID=2704463 RepID=A0A6C0P2J7_9BACL|nr:M56 family metallopeptidase [Paenibacillus rhizovicinus]QHW32063.1 hypothetical protein GZH47_15430 [Paenibacillus rhizovicinus]